LSADRDFAERRLFQPVGPPHRADVPYRKGVLSGGTDAPYYRARRSRGRVALARPDAARDAPAGCSLSVQSRIDLLEELMSRENSTAKAPPPPAARKRVAIVATIWTYLSHAQHIGDRFLVGYPLRGRW